MIGKFVVFLTGGSLGQTTDKPQVYPHNIFDAKESAKKRSVQE